ncbi:MAG: hypothetical protein J6A17_04280 [Bacilli bacterium]|nr:hypothetical protein [Bacilli bacterium]
MKKELKVLLFLIISLIAFTPNIVLANIRCNDGTYSPTCTYNHSGCCSHHGGVASSSYGSSSNSYNSYNKSESGWSSLDTSEKIEGVLWIGGTAFIVIGGLLYEKKSEKK